MFRHLGRTPGELLDYIEHRLEGHTRVEVAALPVTTGLRRLFNAPSVAERAAMPFAVPPPPPRRGPQDIGPVTAASPVAHAYGRA